MIAIDTNIVVRILVRDDEDQAIAAEDLLTEHDIFVPTTVLLESEWVLRDAFGFSKPKVLDALTALLSIRNVTTPNRGDVDAAFALCRAGLGFADALHLAYSQSSDAFATFDGSLVKRAAKLALAAPALHPAQLRQST